MHTNLYHIGYWSLQHYEDVPDIVSSFNTPVVDKPQQQYSMSCLKLHF